MTSKETGVTKSGVAWSTPEAFYAADQRRRDSEEIEYGGDWLSQADPTAIYGVSLVVDTGECYLTRRHRPGVGIAPLTHADDPRRSRASSVGCASAMSGPRRRIGNTAT